MDRLLGSYVEPSPSSILTIRPSHESLMLSSRNSWIASLVLASREMA
jgi:hypothetical protein